MLLGYYNQYNKDKNYKQLQFVIKHGLQTSELNELQSIQHKQVRDIGDAIFADGDIIRGGELSIDGDTKTAHLAPADIYIKGYLHHLATSTLSIPTQGKITLGVLLEQRIITAAEDEMLLSPAKYTLGYKEEGAARLQINAKWSTDTRQGDYYPVHEIINGVQRQNTPPPQLDAVTTAIARFDREVNGSYITHGLQLQYLLTDQEHTQQYSLEEGKAHVNGFEVKLPHAVRLFYQDTPDLEQIESEPHQFEPDSKGKMQVVLDKQPLAILDKIDIEAEKTVTIRHGGYSGAQDPLPDNSILTITEINQIDKTFKGGTDYKLTSGKVDWSMGGKEPSPGSSYDITYCYRKKIAADGDISRTGFILSGAVKGSLVLVDYAWAMPRNDIVTLSQHGQIRQIKGISHPYAPPNPATPVGQLLLATLQQNWIDPPVVENKGVRVVSMSDIAVMQRGISDLYHLVAIDRLKNNATSQERSSVKGVFVDPFLDDDLRDQGIEQDAAIVEQQLILPISVQIQDSVIHKKILLPYDQVAVIEQKAMTGEMKINPYQAFDPLPARVTLTPSVDNWEETRVNWLSNTTRRMTRGRFGFRGIITNTRTELVSRQNSRQTELRPRRVNIEIKGFGPQERLHIVEFDGIQLELKS